MASLRTVSLTANLVWHRFTTFCLRNDYLKAKRSLTNRIYLSLFQAVISWNASEVHFEENEKFTAKPLKKHVNVSLGINLMALNFGARWFSTKERFIRYFKNLSISWCYDGIDLIENIECLLPLNIPTYFPPQDLHTRLLLPGFRILPENILHIELNNHTQFRLSLRKLHFPILCQQQTSHMCAKLLLPNSRH